MRDRILCISHLPLSSHRDMLACATLIEVYYLMLLLDYLSKAYKSHEKNEHGGRKRKFKRLLDGAFNIYLRCDPVSLSCLFDAEYI